MLSYSTVSQVGYICIAIGLGSRAGMAAACFHIIAHAAAKSMLFTAAGGLIRASGRKKSYDALRGAARRDPASAAAFICGSLAMVGIPLFSGFVSKLYTSAASVGTRFESSAILSVVVVSTVLNAMCYFPVVACILAKARDAGGEEPSAEAVASKRAEALETGAASDCAEPRRQGAHAYAPVGHKPSYFATLAAFIIINLGLGIISQPVLALIEKGI
jgi:multicomponent Na+:H+ antiporter subunit D